MFLSLIILPFSSIIVDFFVEGKILHLVFSGKVLVLSERGNLFLGDFLGLCLFLGKLLLEIGHFVGQNPCFWEEIVVFLEKTLHSLQIAAQIIFMWETMHARIMINSLVRVHFLYFLGLQSGIGPIKIPIRIFIRVHLVLKSPTWLLDYAIFCLSCA